MKLLLSLNTLSTYSHTFLLLTSNYRQNPKKCYWHKCVEKKGNDRKQKRFHAEYLQHESEKNEVGMTGFEPATTRPPDAYSNRTELHPELRVQKYKFFGTWQIFSPLFYVFMQKMRSFFVQQPFFRVFGPISIAHWSAKRILPQSDIEVVWTFMKFKICLNFWGVFGPWRRSVASYTTDERSKNGQKESVDWI